MLVLCVISYMVFGWGNREREIRGEDCWGKGGELARHCGTCVGSANGQLLGQFQQIIDGFTVSNVVQKHIDVRKLYR